MPARSPGGGLRLDAHPWVKAAYAALARWQLRSRRTSEGFDVVWDGFPQEEVEDGCELVEIAAAFPLTVRGKVKTHYLLLLYTNPRAYREGTARR